tara:strand:+ start:1180 stop:1725 length:546 start_codon:yes stop_codon:yes gene_type:complete
MMAKWIILNDGEIEAMVLEEISPELLSYYDTDGKEVVEVEEFKSQEFYSFDPAVGWVENLEKVKQKAILAINSRREYLQSKYLTGGVAKAQVYAQKNAEVIKADATVGVLLEEDFPFAATEANVTGETISQVIERFRQGMQSFLQNCCEIEARCQKAFRDLETANSSEEIESVIAGSSLFS